MTIEGSAPRARLAEANLRSLDLVNADVRCGRFSEALPDVLADRPVIDFAFVDGHHEERATVDYFQTIAPLLSPGAVLVFDDVSWSPGMTRAWRRISEDAGVVASVDLFLLGLCVWGRGDETARRYRVSLG